MSISGSRPSEEILEEAKRGHTSLKLQMDNLLQESDSKAIEAQLNAMMVVVPRDHRDKSYVLQLLLDDKWSDHNGQNTEESYFSSKKNYWNVLFLAAGKYISASYISLTQSSLDVDLLYKVINKLYANNCFLEAKCLQGESRFQYQLRLRQQEEEEQEKIRSCLSKEPLSQKLVAQQLDLYRHAIVSSSITQNTDLLRDSEELLEICLSKLYYLSSVEQLQFLQSTIFEKDHFFRLTTSIREYINVDDTTGVSKKSYALSYQAVRLIHLNVLKDALKDGIDGYMYSYLNNLGKYSHILHESTIALLEKQKENLSTPVCTEEDIIFKLEGELECALFNYKMHLEKESLKFDKNTTHEKLVEVKKLFTILQHEGKERAAAYYTDNKGRIDKTLTKNRDKKGIYVLKCISLVLLALTFLGAYPACRLWKQKATGSAVTESLEKELGCCGLKKELKS